MKVNVSGLFEIKNNRIIKFLWLAVFCVLAFSIGPLSSAQAAMWYVDAAATGAENGTSWDDAYLTIQEAIDDPATVADDEIWVKEGTYTLTTQIDVNKGVSIYGGFPAAIADPDWGDRSWETNVTTVDGNDAADHCFYVTVDATIDGFTITEGFADGLTHHQRGGGIFIDICSATIANCTIESNEALTYGGGIYSIGSPSLTITNCIISGNIAGNGGGIHMQASSTMITRCNFSFNDAEYGGAIYYYNPVSTIITNCTFSGNNARSGGGIFNDESDAIITNCVFSGQTSDDHGGAIKNIHNSNPTITNCTFTGNDAPRGGAIYNLESSPIITNCILWGDTASDSGDEIYIFDPGVSIPVVSYSNIEGSGGSGSWDPLLGTDGGGNIDDDPLFVGGLNYRIALGSPAIDAGDNTALPDDLADIDDDGITAEEIPYDLDDNPRRFDDLATADTGNGTAPIVDMGAYEYISSPGTVQFSAATYSVGEAGPTVTITVSRTGGSDGAISVDYASSDGTATAASDYTATGTLTLNWANGDAADKTFTVTIIDDVVDETDETVNLALSNATGGVTIGSQSSAVLTITDDDVRSSSGGGSCFIATASSGLPDIIIVPIIPYLALMLLLFVIGKAAQGERKQ